ncbi:inositol tetrakisphosphate 1 kinase [Trichuris trichiura]|uniref:Inositol tetrakisphosphate 1 kinase n=1 Tax=Trichuris trichiura TaxID=36087 RepID=A0A077YXJ0_TRITR|nr:inositol tetrakisphosphate 1 kinase [Trichuris trichiura]
MRNNRIAPKVAWDANSVSQNEMDEASSKRWRIGYWMTAKKMKKIQFDRFISKCQKENMEILELDFDNIEAQLPLHAIVHKLSDFIVQSDQGDLYAKNIIEKMEVLEKNHPEVLILDPIDAVRILCNRYSQYSLMKTLCAEGPIRTPPFVLLKDGDTKQITALLEKDQISFPFVGLLFIPVCKHLAAHGTENAHRMQLVFGPHGLKDIETPCVIQQFIRHGGILYKMFAIGDDTFISSRPSLRDFTEGDYPTVAFESHKISKIGCISHLTKQQVNFSSDALPAEICGDMPRVFAREFRKSTGLSLFGMDLIVDQSSGQVYVIDVNTFPSYDSLPNFNDLLYRFLVVSLKRQRTIEKRGTVDSGIGSSAESDNSDSEKKLKQLLHQSSKASHLSGENIALYEPDRERLKKYYGIPKTFKSQLCISLNSPNGRNRGRSNTEHS